MILSSGVTAVVRHCSADHELLDQHDGTKQWDSADDALRSAPPSATHAGPLLLCQHTDPASKSRLANVQRLY